MTIYRKLSQEVSSLVELLSPVDETLFYAEYWERRPLHVPASAGGDRATVLTIDDMNSMLSSLVFRTDECKVARSGEIVRSASYTAPAGERVMARAMGDCVDTAALLDLFAQGATLVFSQLNQKWPKLQRLKEALEPAMSASVVTNVFLSNQDSQGFSVHYDSHDVFVVQLHGSKVWSIYDSPIELPTKREAFGSRDVKPNGPPTVLTMQPGDLLYVPRGYFHEARTTETISLHLTIGVHPCLWIDHLRDVLDEIGSMAAPLRRSLPKGEDAAAARVAQLRQILREVADMEGLETIAGAAYHRTLREKTQRGGIRPNHLLNVLAMAELGPLTRLICHEDWRSVTLVRRDDRIVLRGAARRITVPVHWGPMLEALRPGETFALGEVPDGAAPEERLACVRRLAGLGLLALA